MLLGCGCARIEGRHLRQLRIEFPLARSERGGHGNVNDGVEVSPSSFAILQAASTQSELATGLRARRNSQHDGPIQRGHLDICAQRRFPWCKREIEVQVVPIGSKNGVGRKGDVKIKVTVLTSVVTFRAFASQSELLALGHAWRNGHFQCFRVMAFLQ